jgi:release factor glutamine methyltransferase
MKPVNTIDYLKHGEEYLSSQGVPEARISSERLLEKVLQRDKMSLLLDRALVLQKDEEKLFFNLLKKRGEGYPLQYLTQEAGFRGLLLEVKEGVLIPRPETELAVEELHNLFARDKDFKVLDMGTGSGAIALAVAAEFPNAQVVACDISEKALEIARKNAGKSQLSGRVQLFKSDLFQGLAPDAFDVIVSNPPYIPEGERHQLPREVGFEPEEALFAGDSGLEVIARILAEARSFLKNKGYLILEIVKGQAEEILKLAQKNSFEKVSVRKDYCGIERILTFQWKS